MQFFVLRVASNKEDRVREALVRKVKIEGLESQVGRILVPVERVRQIKDGKRRDTDRKLFAGYVFIELELDGNGMIPEKVWFMIKETDGVGDFIGSNGKPTPMSPKDQARMLEEAERPDVGPTLQTAYKKGDRIKVTEGPFVNFEGDVEDIIPDKGMVRIIATIFGRPTPLELEYWQIEKLYATGFAGGGMFRLMQYFGRFQQLQGSFSTLPSWARLVVFVFALPAIAVAALAIVLLGVSIAALLLLTLPVYRVMLAVTGRRASRGEPIWAAARTEFVAEASTVAGESRSGVRRHIEVKIVE